MPAQIHARSGEPTRSSGIAFVAGFFYAFQLAITVLTIDLLGGDAQTGSATRLAIEFLIFLAVCFAAFGSARRSGWLLKLSTVRWVLLYLAFSGCSLLWSEAASLSASALYWCASAANVAIVFLLLRCGDKTHITVSLMKGFVWGALAISCIAWVMPTQYDLRLGDEVLFSANSICNVCVFAVFFCQYLMRERHAKLGFITLLLVLTALRSLSKTTIAAFLIGETYLLIQDRSISRRKKLLLSAAAILVIFVFWGLFEAYYNFYTSNGNQAETLTGRTAIWAYLLNAAPEHLWIGHGFDSMWNVLPAFGTFEARHAENELLEQFYSYGIAGLVLLFGIYGSLYRSLRRFAAERWRVVGVSAILFVAIRGLAEAEPFDLLLPLWMIVLFSALLEYPVTNAAQFSSVADRPNCHPIVISYLSTGPSTLPRTE